MWTEVPLIKHWRVESNYILQPPKYLFVIINRFRSTNNNVTKNKCSIPTDTTVMLGPLKSSLRATPNHHEPSIHSGHQLLQKTFCCNGNKITEFAMSDSKNSSAEYVILHDLINLCVLDSNKRVGVWLLSCGWYILSILSIADRGISAEICGLDDVFPLMAFVPVQKLCVDIYLYILMHSLYEFWS